MRFTLKIECDNAAFCEDDGTESDDARHSEVARILRETAKRVDALADDGRLHDVNGNPVGTFTFSED